MNPDKSKVKLILSKITSLFAGKFNYFIVIFIFIIVLFCFFTIFKPKYYNIQEKTKELAMKTETIYYEKLSRFKLISDYIEVYNEIDAEDVKKVDSMLAEQEIKEEIFTRIESIVKNNGLMLESISIKNDKEATAVSSKKSLVLDENKQNERDLPSEIGKVSFEVNIIGVDYRGLKNLLGVLENNTRIMDVEYVDFSPKGESVNLKITTYFNNK